MSSLWNMINILFVVIICLHGVKAWDTDDFELFDVVEEVGENFYKMLGVAQDAKTPDIRRAYRKLSLQMHPDKNDSPDADVKFRQLVSVYEILKDEQKRQRYDAVLRDGLPDWRQPIYYYRKARKMSVVELFAFLSVILTVGHYIVAWSIFLEKKFEMDELMAPIRKKIEKKKAKGKTIADDDEDLVAAEEYLASQIGCKRPHLTDLMPFLIYRFVVRQGKSLPYRVTQIKDAVQAYKEARQSKAESSDESDEEDTEAKKAEKRQRRRKKVTSVRDASEYEAYDVAPTATTEASSSDKTEEDRTTKKQEWTVKDSALLTRAMVKFPGGTPGRWEKIAHELGRSEAEVTKQVKKMRSAATTTTGAQTYKSEMGSLPVVVTKRRPVVTIDDSVMTKQDRSELQDKEAWQRTAYMTQDDVPDDYDDGFEFEEKDRKRRRKKQTGASIPPDEAPANNTTVENNISSLPNGTNGEEIATAKTSLEWSQSQQKCLEIALAQFGKSVPERWVCIARAVPGKTKEDCFVRYKEIVARVRQKHAAAAAAVAS